MALDKHTLLRRLGGYSLVGVANTAVGYGIIFTLMAFGTPPGISNFIGYAFGIGLSFVLNRFWVFQDARPSASGPKYLVAVAVSYLANLAVLKGLIGLGLWSYAAQVAAGVTYSGILFLLSAFWVFSRHDCKI